MERIFYFQKCCFCLERPDNTGLSLKGFRDTAFGIILNVHGNLKLVAIRGNVLDDFGAAFLLWTTQALCLSNQCGLDLLELPDVALLDLAVLLADDGQFFQQDP